MYYFSQKERNLLSTKPYISHCGIQTDFLDFNKSLSQDWNVSRDVKSLGIVDQVKRVAESALLQTGFVYEQTSGMYYDYNTGYYYDAVCTAIYVYFFLSVMTFNIFFSICFNDYIKNYS